MSEHDLGFIPYPTGFLRSISRFPLQLHRMGLGWMLTPLPFMILTTRGHVSGLPRHVMLEYRQHGSKIYIVSGWGARPHWYQNLVADPCVTVQTGKQDMRARASVVDDPQEALRALYLFRRSSPIYDVILASMSSADTIDLRTLTEVAGEFTVVRLNLDSEPAELQGIRPINNWIGPLLVLSGFALILRWIVSTFFSKPSDAES